MSMATPTSSHEYPRNSIDNNDDMSEPDLLGIPPVDSVSSKPMGSAPSEASSRRKRSTLTSSVWNEFTVIELLGKRKGKCKGCGIEYAYSGTGGGTSNMKKHLDKCPAKTRRDVGQMILSQKSGEMSTRGRRIEQVKLREFISTLILVRNLPFNCVEWPEFRDLCSYLNVDAKSISRNTAKADILKLHKKHKEVIRKKLSSVTGKICFTSDLWTSISTDGYMCLTAHWVDEEWVLQKQLLNFSHIPPPHTGRVMADKIFSMLSDWGIEDKIFSITFDNASSNDRCVEAMINRLALKNTLYCNGEYFHVRCCAHILNLIVKDGLKTLDPTVVKIRDAIKYIKASQARKQRFMEIVDTLGIKEKMGLRQDVPTRWNSTYLMLQSCLAYQKVFEHLKVVDDNYADCPTTAEWSQIGVIFQFPEAFYALTNVFSGSKYPTSNLYFGGICRIQELLLKERYNSNMVISDMAKEMQSKFDKYWADFSPILAMATVFDPRLKLKYVEYRYLRFYDDYHAKQLVQKVYERMEKLFFEYACSHTIASTTTTSEYGETSRGVGTSGVGLDPYLQDYAEAQSQVGSMTPTLSDLQQYLNESALPLKQNIDILVWWKGQEARFPILSQMVRDVLTIPISTVASESAFSIGGRILDQYRSTLKPENAEALVTTRDWIYGVGVDNEEVKLDEIIEDVLGLDINKSPVVVEVDYDGATN